MKPKINHISPHLSEILWEEPISDTLLEKRVSLFELIKNELHPEIIDIRTGYNSIVVQWKDKVQRERLEELSGKVGVLNPQEFNTWEIPVCYGGHFGKDLGPFAMSKSMSEEEVIQLHSEQTYRIHFFGFLPGFMYLHGLNRKLSSPRKSVPARSVPAGSIAIGGDQTGIYPSSSPGGWHLIGQTPLLFFQPKNPKPVWANVGDWIRFKSVNEQEFDDLVQNSSPPQAI
ncbi:5-oxoprolinase subunit PxpB [Algoriphagus namhaensis]|uniref:5-oxoprolinase subunit PxpB n=1 Tax=Algoriphagus namhaensis TaxID=915353 RepID=A0ABV8AWT5_9BACT